MNIEHRILLIEDLPTDAELAERELRNANIIYIARRVETKEAFLKELMDFKPDIILSDYSLPQFDGLEALRLLKELELDVPFILITGSLTEEVAVRCMKEGANDYILKTSLKRLSSAVLNALEKKKAQREKEEAVVALRRSEKLYRLIAENTRDLICMIDVEGHFVYASPSCRDCLGYAPEELLGRRSFSLIHPEDKEAEMQRFREGLSGKKGYRGEFRYRHQDGEWLDFESVGNWIFDWQGNPQQAVLICRDITQRKRTEEALHQSEEQLRQSQKLEAVGQLASGVAHDFNNLLTAINGYSELTLRRLTDEPLRRYIEEIKKAGDRAASLTRQLLAFSRKQVLKPKVMELNSVVADMDNMLRRLIGEDVELVTTLDLCIGQVIADSGQIEQVVLNLALNARDAMPNGGKLTIETANVLLDESYVHAHAEVQPGQYVMLAVSDTGCGMDSQTRERIFEPFFTTKELGKGTGLGLSTVYGIVKQSGGHLWVDSEVGRGTTFKLYLPHVNEKVKESIPNVVQTDVPEGWETVLLVEDEQVVRELACRMLREQGYNVLEASSGEQALRAAQEQAGQDIHLLLTDIVMPRMNGQDLAEQLIQTRPRIQILFMSGHTSRSRDHQDLLENGTPLIHKPFSLEGLARKVREVLDASHKEHGADTFRHRSSLHCEAVERAIHARDVESRQPAS
jgi:two-component system cell cycle sensor histidine kinase/response regulator CckA